MQLRGVVAVSAGRWEPVGSGSNVHGQSNSALANGLESGVAGSLSLTLYQTSRILAGNLAEAATLDTKLQVTFWWAASRSIERRLRCRPVIVEHDGNIPLDEKHLPGSLAGLAPPGTSKSVELVERE